MQVRGNSLNPDSSNPFVEKPGEKSSHQTKSITSESHETSKGLKYKKTSNTDYCKRFLFNCLGPIGSLIKGIHFVWKFSTDKSTRTTAVKNFKSIFSSTKKTDEVAKNRFDKDFKDLKTDDTKKPKGTFSKFLSKVTVGITEVAKKVGKAVAGFFLGGGAMKVGAALLGASILFPPLAIAGGALFIAGAIGLGTSMRLTAKKSPYLKYIPNNVVEKNKELIEKWKAMKAAGDKASLAKDIFFFAMDHTVAPFVGGLLTAGVGGASGAVKATGDAVGIDIKIKDVFDFDLDITDKIDPGIKGINTGGFDDIPSFEMPNLSEE